MHNFKSLYCYNCKSVILSLSEIEICKLDGLNFQCDCCGHQNLLTEDKFFEGTNDDPYRNVFSVDNIMVV